jgi:hypothetical protein
MPSLEEMLHIYTVGRHAPFEIMHSEYVILGRAGGLIL